MARNDIALGIDVGGTFTDVLAFDRTSGVIISQSAIDAGEPR